MKFKLFFLSLLTLSLFNGEASETNTSPVKIIPKVIYGDDNRLDVFESSDSLMREISRSTAAQILNDNISLQGNVYSIKAKTLEDLGMCTSERFSNQMTAAICSGFLIAEDILITAGHCIKSEIDCANSSWVFDYSNTVSEKTSFTFTKDQVFHCTKVFARELNRETMNDYSVVKLDRPVPGRTALKFRTSGKVADNTVFTVIGHPTGLPTKITNAAEMRDNTNRVYFRTNADTYGGNSGSAVVDSKTGMVEGILVRGDQDYQKSEDSSCTVSTHREQNSGRGEDATRITNIGPLKNILFNRKKIIKNH